MKRQTVLADAKRNMSQPGYAIFQHLVEWLASRDVPTTYEPVGRAVGLPWEHNCLGGYLGEISEYTHEKYGFLISAIVHSAGTAEPGNGFPQVAWDLGVRINSPLWYEQERVRMAKWAKSLL